MTNGLKSSFWAQCLRPNPDKRGFTTDIRKTGSGRALAALFGECVPESAQARRDFALAHKIALWDVLHQCEIDGASDASIRKPVPNDLNRIFAYADIRQVFANGRRAADLYGKYCRPDTGRDCVRLPSTSPANCRIPFSALVESYRAILDYL